MSRDTSDASRRSVLRRATLGLAVSGLSTSTAAGGEPPAHSQEVNSPHPIAINGVSGGVVSVTDFGARGDGRTDDTRAIQAALTSGASLVLFPSGRASRHYLFSNLTIPLRVRLAGQSIRGAVLYQRAGATGAALTFERDLPSYGVRFDISDGGASIENLTVNVASDVGLRIRDGATASMFNTQRFRLVHRHHQSLGPPPYDTPAGSIGIEVDGGWVDGRPAEHAAPVYMADHNLGEIRGFETAIKASGVVNEWTFRSFWLIDNKVAFDLADASTWSINATVESGVEAARAIILRRAISNLTIAGGRWELTQRDAFGIEFAAGLSATNVVIADTNFIIESDGSALPGRKWTGKAPASMIMSGSFLDPIEDSPRYFCIAPSQAAVRFPTHLRIGGHKLGDGRIEFGRDHDNGALSSIFHDGSALSVDSPNGFRVAQPGAGQAWKQPFLLGDYCLWVDQEGRLRISPGYPSHDLAGAAVGAQT